MESSSTVVPPATVHTKSEISHTRFTTSLNLFLLWIAVSACVALVSYRLRTLEERLQSLESKSIESTLPMFRPIAIPTPPATKTTDVVEAEEEEDLANEEVKEESRLEELDDEEEAPN